MLLLALVTPFLNLYFSINDPETLQVIFSLSDLKLNETVSSIQVKLRKLSKNSFQTDRSAKVVDITSHRDSHNFPCMYPSRVLTEGVQPDVLPM